jgi:hypothetical protein
MLRFSLFSLFAFFICFGQTFAQDSLLTGKWQISSMMRDSVMTFDQDDIQVSLEARYLNTLKEKDVLTEADSAEIQTYIEEVHAKMKQMYYEFLGDGKLKAGVLDLEDGQYVFKEKEGAYYVDGDKLWIHVGGNSTASIFSIKDNELTLIQIIAGEPYKRGFGKYKLTQ